jgi:lipopolysaccharide biosynthesis regulator YciM
MLRAGSTLLILGIMVSLFGLLMTLHQTTIINYISGIIQDANVIELIGTLLVLLGAVLVTTGLTMDISSIIEVKLEDERERLISGVRTATQNSVANAVASQMQTLAPQKCRFCGAKLSERDKFCPSCGKSQM